MSEFKFSFPTIGAWCRLTNPPSDFPLPGNWVKYWSGLFDRLSGEFCWVPERKVWLWLEHCDYTPEAMKVLLVHEAFWERRLERQTITVTYSLKSRRNSIRYGEWAPVPKHGKYLCQLIPPPKKGTAVYL